MLKKDSNTIIQIINLSNDYFIFAEGKEYKVENNKIKTSFQYGKEAIDKS